ncbi:hypothetical protein M8J76_013657 [Diaphorina citri]|nr:hypothetical protein M8J76_013657 [Diaphorina citri]KAI5725898.1 hypothetical protein M8J77_021420 [Diaphorina citri]
MMLRIVRHLDEFGNKQHRSYEEIKGNGVVKDNDSNEMENEDRAGTSDDIEVGMGNNGEDVISGMIKEIEDDD